MTAISQPAGPSPGPAERIISPSLNMDWRTDLGGLVRLAFIARQIEGREPFVRTIVVDCRVSPLCLLPHDAVIVRSVTGDTSLKAMARCPRGTLLVSAVPESSQVVISVSAASDELAGSLAAEVRGRIPAPPGAGTVEIRMWHMGGNGNAVAADRHIAAPAWEEVARNYPFSVREQLGLLTAVHRPAGTGKLILFHGGPGTGKTTALRALLRTWEPWCAGHFVSDPERLFCDPGYIADVLTRAPSGQYGGPPPDAGGPDAMWRLIIAEDSDEYLRASARHDAGAGLGRLLNLTDGVLGQGSNTLVLLTTNEELHRLHPALVRPGRCLARIAFKSFSPAEAGQWLRAGAELPEQDATLAELFEQCGALERIGIQRQAEEKTGAYL